MNKLEEILKEGHMVGELFGEPWRSLPKDNFDWLIKQAEKAERYEKALEKIEKTSGTSMFHNFTVEFKDDIMEIVKMNEVYGELMQILHSECEKCPLRLSCIEEKCSVFRIEKSIQKEIEGEEND